MHEQFRILQGPHRGPRLGTAGIRSAVWTLQNGDLFSTIPSDLSDSMHELSIAMSIIDLVEEESERRGGAAVFAVHLKLGPLSGVVKEALISAWDLAREETVCSESKLVIQEIPITIYCTTCLAENPVESIQSLCCAACGTPSPRVITGRELEVTGLEIGG